MTSFSFAELLKGQFAHIAVFMVVGLILGMRERRAPARSNTGYSELRTDIAAVVVTFLGACAFGVLTAYLSSFEALKPTQTAIAAAPWFVLIIATSLVGDLLNYLAHRFLHTEHMWRFHRWHHSSEHLFWFSGFRGSFVHLFIMASKNILLLVISGLNPWVLGTLAIQGICAQMLGHVNFDLNVPVLSRFIVMPQYHRIHHAVDREKHDSNFGFFYSFWDKIFGTQTDPAKTSANFDLGLPKNEKVSIWQMLVG